MKKIIFIVVCLCSAKLVNAEGLLLTYLPYYVKVNDNEIIRVRKLLEVETDNVLFNTDIFNYQLTTDVSKDKMNEDFKNLDYFNTIIYYGYNNTSKKYDDYFLTQILIWELYSNLEFSIVDKSGNPVDEYNDSLNIIKEKIKNHYKDANVLDKTYELLVGDSLDILCDTSNLDIPNIDGLTIENNDDNIKIIANKIGKYELSLNKEYDKNNYLYTDGKYTYYASLGGPATINKKITINVKGINLKIIDNFIGVNNKYGDSILESKYALYKNEELIKELSNNDFIEILPNTNYILKDISNNISINKHIDMLINLNSNYELNIKKEVVSKNLKINVNDKYTYNIYLKSNNELYDVINKNIKEITLPYGLYYIVCKDIDFYDELKIQNDIPLTLNIDNSKEIIEENSQISEGMKEEIIKKDDIEPIPENPQTLDNIHIDLFTYLCCLASMGISVKKIYRLERRYNDNRREKTSISKR